MTVVHGVGALGVTLEPDQGEVGLHPARVDFGHPHPGVDEFHAHHMAERMHPVFGGIIAGTTPVTPQPGNRTNVHHVAVGFGKPRQ